MSIESELDLLGLLKIGRICGLTIQHMARSMEVGMTTAELDAIGAQFLARHGARPAPALLYNYPAATCISVNEAVAHGIPGSRVIQAGDLVNIDVSAELNGYIADTGATFPVPPVLPEQQRLCDATRQALAAAIDSARAGNRLNEIGRAVETQARRHGFTVIRALNGHGVGRRLHEEPRNIPSYYTARARQRLREGMVFTIEPFLTTGKGQIVNDADGWTIRTIDGAWTAQYEHTIVVTKDRPILVTAV